MTRKMTILILGLLLSASTQAQAQNRFTPSPSTSRAASAVQNLNSVNFSATTLEIANLYCIMPADRVIDELRLEVTVDGVPRTILRKTVRKGSAWRFNPTLRYSFSQKVEVKLYEEDGPGSADFLGTVTIYPGSKSNGRSYFRGAGAEYLLNFNVQTR